VIVYAVILSLMAVSTSSASAFAQGLATCGGLKGQATLTKTVDGDRLVTGFVKWTTQQNISVSSGNSRAGVSLLNRDVYGSLRFRLSIGIMKYKPTSSGVVNRFYVECTGPACSAEGVVPVSSYSWVDNEDLAFAIRMVGPGATWRLSAYKVTNGSPTSVIFNQYRSTGGYDTANRAEVGGYYNALSGNGPNTLGHDKFHDIKRGSTSSTSLLASPVTTTESTGYWIQQCNSPSSPQIGTLCSNLPNISRGCY
jgi:hypothetical protein